MSRFDVTRTISGAGLGFPCTYGVSERLENAIINSYIGERIQDVLGNNKNGWSFVQDCPHVTTTILRTLREQASNPTGGYSIWSGTPPLSHRAESLLCPHGTAENNTHCSACYIGRGFKGCESMVCSSTFPYRCVGVLIRFRDRYVYGGSYFDYLAGRVLIMALREMFAGRLGDMFSPSQRKVVGSPVPAIHYKSFYFYEWDIVSIFNVILKSGTFYLRISRDVKHSSISTEYQSYDTQAIPILQIPVKVPLELFTTMCDTYAYSFTALCSIALAIESERNAVAAASCMPPGTARGEPTYSTGAMYSIAQDMLRKYEGQYMTYETLIEMTQDVSRIVADNFMWITSAIAAQNARCGNSTPITHESVVSNIMRLVHKLIRIDRPEIPEIPF